MDCASVEEAKKLEKFWICVVVKGLKPIIAAYSTMLHGYATEGCLVDMTNLYNLINAYAKCGSVDQAIVTFEDMERQGLPDAVTYSTMINAFYRKGRMDDAIEKFNQMINIWGYCRMYKLTGA
jgi:pentatricopeptide repeat protein